MPQITGIDFLKSLKDPPAVIINTIFRALALGGYDLNIIDHLRKPITFARLFKAIDKYLRSIKPDNGVALTLAQKSYLVLKYRPRNHRFNADNILYLESFKDNILVVF